MQQQKDTDTKESSGSSSDEKVEEFVFQVSYENGGIKEDSKQIFVATFGIQSLWLTQILKQNGAKRIGHINYSKATQSSLASIYQNQDCLAVVFNKEIKDYHYNDYNFGHFLNKLTPNAGTAQFIVLTDININLLSKKIQVSEIELRLVSNQKDITLKLPYMETPNEFQGLFSDIVTQLIIQERKVIGIVLVLEEYESKYSHLEALAPLSIHFGFKSTHVPKEDIVEEIRKLNQTRHKDIIYL